VANETLNIVVEAKDNTRQGLSRAERSLGGFGKAATALMQGVGLGAGKMLFDGIVGGIQKAAGVLPQLMMEGAQLQSVENTFQNLAKSIGTSADAMIRELRPAARGMVSDAELMQAANKFMSMGLAETTEEAAGLTEMATQLAVAMGKDATFGMESFALMLANQSIERLDEFGISSGRVRQRIDELMDATEDLTREDAFKMAVFEEGAKAMGRVGEQGDNAAGAIGRLRSSFENVRDTIALAAVPFVDEFAPVIQEFVDENAPKLFETIDKLTEYLFGRPAGMEADPLTGLLRIDPGQVGAAEGWAAELRRIFGSISEGAWDELFPDLETWGPDDTELAEFGADIAETIIEAIGGVLGPEATSDSLAAQLGRAIARIPSKISWILWGIGAEIAMVVTSAVGGTVTPEMEEELLGAGFLGAGRSIRTGFLEDLEEIPLPPWAQWLVDRVGGTAEAYREQWPGSAQELAEILVPPTPKRYVPLQGEVQTRFITGKYPIGPTSEKRDYPPGYTWREHPLGSVGSALLPLADMPPGTFEVEVYPKPPDPAEWRNRGHEAMVEWLVGAEEALGADVATSLERNALLHELRAYGVR